MPGSFGIMMVYFGTKLLFIIFHFSSPQCLLLCNAS